MRLPKITTCDASAAALLSVGLFLAGCASTLPATRVDAPPESLTERAVEQERRSCGADLGSLDPRLFVPEIVQNPEPLYSVAETKHGRVNRLLGAQLRLGAQPTMTAEWLERTLKCHSARRVLGQLPEMPSDPYWLPGGWIDIEVNSERDGFLVSLRGEDTDQSRQIFDRARYFFGR